jgi:hypothetical protein
LKTGWKNNLNNIFYAFRLVLVPIDGGEEHLAHLFAEGEGFEDFDAVALLEQLVKEI